MSIIFVVEEAGDNAMTKPREPLPTVAFIDDYCAHYRTLFPNVRQFEQFTHLELTRQALRERSFILCSVWCLPTVCTARVGTSRMR